MLKQQETQVSLEGVPFDSYTSVHLTSFSAVFFYVPYISTSESIHIKASIVLQKSIDSPNKKGD